MPRLSHSPESRYARPPPPTAKCHPTITQACYCIPQHDPALATVFTARRILSRSLTAYAREQETGDAPLEVLGYTAVETLVALRRLIPLIPLCIGTALIEAMLAEGEKRNVTVLAHLVFTTNFHPAHQQRHPASVPEHPLPYHTVCGHYLVLENLCDRLEPGVTY